MANEKLVEECKATVSKFDKWVEDWLKAHQLDGIGRNGRHKTPDPSIYDVKAIALDAYMFGYDEGKRDEIRSAFANQHL